MRSILNVIFDILTLMALVIAGVGHMLPWFRADLRSDRFEARDFKLDWPQRPDRAPEQEARRQLSVGKWKGGGSRCNPTRLDTLSQPMPSAALRQSSNRLSVLEGNLPIFSVSRSSLISASSVPQIRQSRSRPAALASGVDASTNK